MKKLKLPIELIPVPCLGKNLRTTLTAWQWHKLRANCFKLANYVCDAYFIAKRSSLVAIEKLIEFKTKLNLDGVEFFLNAKSFIEKL